MALALSKAGADLILVQRNTTNTATKDRIEKEGGAEGKGGKAEIVVCDLGDAASVSKLIPGVVAQGHVLDIVVNCGGIQRRHPVEVFPDDDWNEVLQVNLNAVFQITRDAGKHMLESRGGVAGQPGKPYKSNGKIIDISSLVAFQGGLNVVAYAAAKHGVQGIVSKTLFLLLGTCPTNPPSGQGLFERLGFQGCQRERYRSRIHCYRHERGAHCGQGPFAPDPRAYPRRPLGYPSGL